jgi:hypothetical protein
MEIKSFKFLLVLIITFVILFLMNYIGILDQISYKLQS